MVYPNTNVCRESVLIDLRKSRLATHVHDKGSRPAAATIDSKMLRLAYWLVNDFIDAYFHDIPYASLHFSYTYHACPEALEWKIRLMKDILTNFILTLSCL